jgi:hypothetical protein
LQRTSDGTKNNGTTARTLGFTWWHTALRLGEHVKMAQCMCSTQQVRICLVGTQWHDSMHIASTAVCAHRSFADSQTFADSWTLQAHICKGTEAATRRSVSASIASMYLAAIAAANMFTVGCCHPILP